MSFICGLPILECVYCLGCARWVWKKCLYTAGYESENWGLATTEEFEPVPRICRLILAVYEEDIRNPQWAPEGGYGINPDWIVLRKDYGDNQVHNRDKLGIQRNKIRCFAIASPRCMSLNLAVRYADVINSVVLQDTCTLEEKQLRDPTRLYAPGRLYHIVERKPFR
ncbi:calmodulin-binding heat-shock protein [Spatholobus suberectus]|nr:calmodulin-binding heat-shock protein [Spatholobus suberectus]